MIKCKYKLNSKTGCWNWLLSQTKTGYGQQFFMGAKRGAHRVAFFLAFGYWPKEVAHRCFNRACVNPEHLKDSTHIDNVRESAASTLTLAMAVRLASEYKGRYGDRVRIAKRYGVSVSTVGRILRGGSWHI